MSEHKYKIGECRETGEVLLRFVAPVKDVFLSPERALELAAYLVKFAKASRLYKPPS